MRQDLVEVSAIVRHGTRPGFAQPDPVPLADPLHNHLPSFRPRREVVAWDRVPAEPPYDDDSRILVKAAEFG